MGKFTSKLAPLVLATASLSEGNKAAAQTAATRSHDITPQEARELVIDTEKNHVLKVISLAGTNTPLKQTEADQKRIDNALKPLIRNNFRDPAGTLQNACVTTGTALSRHQGKPTVYVLKQTPDNKGTLDVTLHVVGGDALYEHRLPGGKSHVCEQIVRKANQSASGNIAK